MCLLTKRERRVSLPVTKVRINTFDLEEEEDNVMMALEEGGEQRSHVPGVTKVGVSVLVLEQGSPQLHSPRSCLHTLEPGSK